MKNLWFVLLVFLLTSGCQRTPNEVLSDSLIPPEDQLVKVTAENLASDFAAGKKRSLLHDNDADKKYSGKWLKVSGVVDSVFDKNDGYGYNITLKTFAAHPKVICNGKRQENELPLSVGKNQQLTAVGRLVSKGTDSTLYLISCKYLR